MMSYTIDELINLGYDHAAAESILNEHCVICGKKTTSREGSWTDSGNVCDHCLDYPY